MVEVELNIWKAFIDAMLRKAQPDKPIVSVKYHSGFNE